MIQRLLRFKFVRDAGALTTSRFLVSCLTFVQGVLVARWLGPAGFGVAALVMSYPELVFSFFDARSNAATVKYVAEFSAAGQRERVLAMFKLSLLVDLGIALLTVAVVWATGWWAETRIVHTPGVAPLMLLYAASFLPRAASMPCRAALEVLGKFRTVAWIEVTAKSIGVITVLWLVLSGFGVAGVVVGNAITLVLSGVGITLSAWPKIRQAWGVGLLRASLRALRGRGREIGRFLMYTELTELVGLVSKQADLVILGFFTGPQEVGYFRLARKMAGLVDVLVQPLQSVLYPRMAGHWGAGRHEELARTLHRYIWWIGVPLAAAVCFALPVVPLAITWVVGSEYLPATLATQLLLLGAAVWLAFSWFRPLAHALGAMRFLFISAAVANGLCALGYVIAIPRWKAAGAAMVWLVIGVFQQGLSGVYYWRYLRRRLSQPGRAGSTVTGRTLRIVEDAA